VTEKIKYNINIPYAFSFLYALTFLKKYNEATEPDGRSLGLEKK
jgi:hypothetical protein